MMQNVNDLAKKVWGEDAKEVIDFLHKEDLYHKEKFLNENSMINYIARILIRHCNRRIDKSKHNDLDFWKVRGLSIQTNIEFKSRVKNILYVIRLLTGKLPIPSSESEEESKYDFKEEHLKDMEEESFWENAEKKRESWIF